MHGGVPGAKKVTYQRAEYTTSKAQHAYGKGQVQRLFREEEMASAEESTDGQMVESTWSNPNGRIQRVEMEETARPWMRQHPPHEQQPLHREVFVGSEEVPRLIPTGKLMGIPKSILMDIPMDIPTPMGITWVYPMGIFVYTHGYDAYTHGYSFQYRSSWSKARSILQYRNLTVLGLCNGSAILAPGKTPVLSLKSRMLSTTCLFSLR